MLRFVFLVLLVVAGAFMVACGDDDGGSGGPDASPGDTSGGDGGVKVTSREFGDGEAIPVDFTCDGDNVAPPIDWTGIPEGAKSLALVMDDPDAGNFAHWVVFDIPVKVTGFGVTPGSPELPSEARQAKNDFGDVGYGGPCPPDGEEHTYRIIVTALDSKLGLDAGVPAADVIAAIEAAGPLDDGKLEGTFAK
ncbi:MAG: YbhB/YbcL family Raf kinase inhibitor-like protein [Dehalococcoidia bacterium]